MTTLAKLNALHCAENPARELLEKLGWTYVPRKTLAAVRGGRTRGCQPASRTECARLDGVMQ